MLSACGNSPKPGRAADPIVEKTIEYRTVCPAELSAAAPAVVADYDGPAIDVPKIYLDWLAKHLRREALLGFRLEDARVRCEAEREDR